ncbi:unnamed protein product [Linum trigynum]|uniref:CCHC-type domain-containing protein n=1 Tax=Linum trigynum TaxID=586398 RepID=A0AAV2ET67_9ROSI
MYERFTNIVNSLENIGKSYESGDLVRKILWCLPEKWTPKVTAIEEAKDLEKLAIDELIGSLTTHEDKLMKAGSEKEINEKGKRGITFKAISSVDEPEELEDMEDEELALLSKQISRLIRFRKEKKMGGTKSKEIDRNEGDARLGQSRGLAKGRNEAGQSLRGISTTGCFKCGRAGHIKAECPLLKRDKAFTATWSGSEDEGDDDYEVTVHRSYIGYR